MQSNGKTPLLSRRWIIVLAAAGLLTLYVVTGFLIVPRIVQAVLPEKLSAVTGRIVTLESSAFNPFTLEITLNKFAILEKDQTTFASIGRLYANAQLLPLIIGKAVLKEVAIDDPSLSVEFTNKGFNFTDMIPGTAPGENKAEPKPDGEMPAFLIKKVALSSGNITFKDQTAGTGFSLALSPISVAVENLGSREKAPARYTFEISTRSGAVLAGQGTVDLSKLISAGQVDLKGLPVTQFEPYYRQFIKANIKSGKVGFSLSYTYPAVPENPLPTVKNASVTLNNFVVTGPRGSVRMINMPEFAVTGIQLNPDKQTVQVGRVRLADTYVRADRSEDGGIYLVEAFLPTIAASPEPESSTDESNAPRWLARLEKLEVAHLAFALNEFSASSPSVYSFEKMDVHAADIEFDTAHKEGLPKIARAGISLQNIKIAAVDAKDALISIPKTELNGISLDPDNRLLTVETVVTEKGAVALQRDATGRLNLIESLPAVIATKESPDASTPPEQVKPAPLAAFIQSVAVEDYTVAFQDLTTPTPAVLQMNPITLKVGNISTAPNEKATFAISIGGPQGGAISSQGEVSLTPLAGEIEIKADKLKITPLQPYLNERIQVLITGGEMDAAGKMTFRMDPEKGYVAGFKGDTLLANFASLDKYLGKDLLRWKSLQVSGIDLDINPLRIDLEEIALADFYARATVNEDGTVNLRTVMESEKAAGQSAAAQTGEDNPRPVDNPSVENQQVTAEATQPMPDQPIPPITIKAVTLQGGTVSFADRLIKPHFKTEMLELGGNISGLSSAELARADVFLAGRLENHSPLKITGKINPLIRDKFTDISIEFRDIDLSPFTPYTGKYLGYKLEKGKLTLILNYRLSQNTLVAQNKIRFNRLTLGEKVDSPDATSLPVKLGLAILSDSEGNVELDLPVRGSVDDPEFSLGSIILKAVVGLVTKTITAPFAALGAAFAGGAELSYINFEAGLAGLGDEQTETLTNLATALVERPALNLEITGIVDPDTDGAQLRIARYDDLIQAQHIRTLYKGGQAPPEDQRPAISAEAREAYVARAYQEADIPKPRNADGSLKTLPVDEMEKLLFTAITISPADLRHLAIERAETAKNSLLGDDRLKPERLFITEPIITPPAAATEPLQPQVKFAIQK